MERTPTDQLAPQPPSNGFDAYVRHFAKSRCVRSRSDGATVTCSCFYQAPMIPSAEMCRRGERGFRRRRQISVPQRGSYTLMVYAMSEVLRGSWVSKVMLRTIAPGFFSRMRFITSSFKIQLRSPSRSAHAPRGPNFWRQCILHNVEQHSGFGPCSALHGGGGT